jgi:hypothetical protein
MEERSRYLAQFNCKHCGTFNGDAAKACTHSWRHLRTEIRSREFTDYKVDVFHCGHCLEYREVEWPR